MLKPLIYCAILLLMSEHLAAQTLPKDSLVKVAYTDAQRFELSKDGLRQFRKSGKSGRSDLFKPSTATTSNPAFLTDSAYTDAFRIAAYNKTVKKRTLGHKVAVGGLVYAGATVLAATVLLFVLLGKASK